MHPEKQALIDDCRDDRRWIGEIEEYDEGYSLLAKTRPDDAAPGGMGLSLSKKYGVVPHVGDQITLYTEGLSLIRGVDINGEEVFFKSSVELENDAIERHERYVQDKKDDFAVNVERYDAEFDALPESFQYRISSFRDNNPDFRWEFEPYELFCCTEAVKIADHLTEAHELTYPVDNQDLVELVKEFSDLPHDEQLERASLIDEHSGNTFGCAVTLARLYLFDQFTIRGLPKQSLVFQHHGALVPLVGCKNYGCIHPR